MIKEKFSNVPDATIRRAFNDLRREGVIIKNSERSRSHWKKVLWIGFLFSPLRPTA